MRAFVFACYPHVPVACEGDDPLTKSVTLRLKSAERIQRVVDVLTRRLGGYVQFWG